MVDLDAEDLLGFDLVDEGGVVESEFVEGAGEHAGGFANDEVFLAFFDGAGGGDFGDADFLVVVGDFSGEQLLAAGFVAVGHRPALLAAEVVAGGVAAVVDFFEVFVERFDELGGEGLGLHGIDAAAVGGGDGGNVFGGAAAAFELEGVHAGFEDLVEEVDGADVVGRHDEVVVDEELFAGLLVDDFVFFAAVLGAGAAVGGGVVGVEGHAAAAGDGDAEGAVGEGFDFDGASGGAAEVVVENLLADLADHGEVELAGEHDAVAELGVELEGLVVGDGELGGEVDF